MIAHFDTGDGLEPNTDPATEGYQFNHTMIRIKDPHRSLDFYSRVLGMRLLRRLDFEELQFSLYFMGYVTGDIDDSVPRDPGERTAWTFSRPGVLELTHNWGTEEDPNVQFHNGNEAPQGFGHLAIAVPDIDAACERFESLAVDFVKRPNEGKIQGLAFIRDPDGYWIEVVQPDRLTSLG